MLGRYWFRIVTGSSPSARSYDSCCGDSGVLSNGDAQIYNFFEVRLEDVMFKNLARRWLVKQLRFVLTNSVSR